MLTYEALPEKIKDYFQKNITMSVAFVKRGDGVVRHMAFRRNLTSYIKSDREKSEKQISVIPRNNLFLVYDTNLYIKALREFDGDSSAAAKKCIRAFGLENVLAFMCGGKVYDMREINNISERFGEEISSQLTKNMVRAMESEEKESEDLDNIIKENKNYKLKQFIIKEVKRLHEITLLEEQKKQIEGQLRLLTEDTAVAQATSAPIDVILKDYINAKKVIFDPNSKKVTVVKSGALGGVADFHKVFNDVINKLKASGHNPTHSTGSNEITIMDEGAASYYNDRLIAKELKIKEKEKKDKEKKDKK